MAEITFKIDGDDRTHTISNVPDSTRLEDITSAIKKNTGKDAVWLAVNGKVVIGKTAQPATTTVPQSAPQQPTVRKTGPARIDPANPGDWIDTGSGHYYNTKTHELRLK